MDTTPPSPRIAQCSCGRMLALSRALTDQPGKLVKCSACGYELRVWQWAAREHRQEARRHG